MNDRNVLHEHPYATGVAAYGTAGWTCILPVPRQDKYPPPQGFTGEAGRDTDPMVLLDWAHTHAEDSVALRMPPGVIGIDVDQYAKAGKHKHGAETIARLSESLGPLPPTWSSTARGTDTEAGESGIRFFRVPVRRYRTVLKATHPDGTETGDVEIIQRHHRYAVVWPSPHPGAGTGAIYRWYSPDGVLATEPPAPEALPQLPLEWVNHLAIGATEAGPAAADVASGEALLGQIQDDSRPECSEVTSAKITALDKLGQTDAGSRHDTMVERTHHLVQLGAKGHPGVGAVLEELRALWNALTSGEGRDEEFTRGLLTSARKAVSVVGTVQVWRDPCMLMDGAHIPVVRADDPGTPGKGESDVETVVAPPRWAGPREVIGAAAFDPQVDHDQGLAEAVLERTHPALRFAYDSGGWLLRAPDRWELHGRLSSWAVAQVAPLMPVGDSAAEKGSEQQRRAARRQRLLASGGARSVANKVDDLVTGGMHPNALALADLDADPEVLWAGGYPWDLRASTHEAGPQLAARIDVTHPHLHTAAVMPQRRHTPLWDAFLKAVWPDPEVRAWAVRVLAITLTGYADRALPILLGETGRGKTQVVALIMSLLRTYAHSANPKLLSPNPNEHDTIVFDLKGRRLSFIDEAPSEAKAGQERLKQLTGGGELTGRQMNQDSITFAPTHTFVLTANDEPVLTDPAVRSRSRLIPCDGDPEAVRQARAAIGSVTGAAWRFEAPGVLAWLMGEAAAWLAEPTTAAQAAAPERIRFLAEQFGAEQDPVAVWVVEECEPCAEGTAARELYQAFVASCRRNSMRADAIPSETKWGRVTTRLGYPSVHTEHGKRRRLRVRHGGFLPGMPAPANPSEVQAPQATQNVNSQGVSSGTCESAKSADGLGVSPDGFLTGSDANPSGVFPQVTPRESHAADGSDGLNQHLYAYTGAHAPVNSDLETGSNPSDPSAGDPAVTRKKPQSAEAKQRAAEKRAADQAERVRVAEAGHIGLPALLLADGTAHPGDLTQLDALLATITGTGHALTVDVETSGFPVGHEHYAMRTIQLGGPGFAAVLDAGVPEQTEVAARHLAAAAQLHAHSATADLVPLAVAGLVDFDEAWSRMEDTVVLAKLADPASTGSDPGLKQLAPAVLGGAALTPGTDAARAALFKAGKWLTDTKITTPLARSGWAQVNSGSATMVKYAGSDVIDDARLAIALPRPDDGVLERERLVQRMTARVAHQGVRLDPEHVAALRETHTKAKAVAAEAVRVFGIENPGSNPQIGEAFTRLGHELPRTGTGRTSVAEAVLAPLEHADGEVGDLARAVLTYRHHETALGTFLEPYHQLVVNGDGRARPTVYTLGTDTGRMSCVRPNIQQLPRSGGVRSCITADPGEMLISADFSGVEIRVAAALSGDPNLTQMVLAGVDLHAEVAKQVWGPDATKANRYMAKRIVFGRLYGGGLTTLAQQAGVSESVAQQAVDVLDAITPGLSEWSRLTKDGVRSGRTQFRSYAGRVIHLPRDTPHKAPNYCIQGSARELLVDALVKWSTTKWGGAVLFPVHDELVIRVPEDDAEEATRTLADVMANNLAGIPIVADPSEPSFAWKDSS